MTSKISSVICADRIFKYGHVHGVFDIPKEDADKLCVKLSEEGSYDYDWHYFGGRVRVLRLHKDIVKELSDE